MKKLIAVVFIISSCFTSAQQTKLENLTCFDTINIEAGFIAFSTSKKSNLGKWYQEIFNLEIVKEFSFPDGSIDGVLMKNNEFVVEVFYRDDVLNGKDYVAESDSEQWKGFMKFGMYTDANLIELQNCLKEKGINVVRIYNDKNLGVDLLQIRDPEGNVLEIISRISKN